MHRAMIIMLLAAMSGCVSHEPAMQSKSGSRRFERSRRPYNASPTTAGVSDSHFGHRHHSKDHEEQHHEPLIPTPVSATRVYASVVGFLVQKPDTNGNSANDYDFFNLLSEPVLGPPAGIPWIVGTRLQTTNYWVKARVARFEDGAFRHSEILFGPDPTHPTGTPVIARINPVTGAVQIQNGLLGLSGEWPLAEIATVSAAAPGTFMLMQDFEEGITPIKHARVSYLTDGLGSTDKKIIISYTDSGGNTGSKVSLEYGKSVTFRRRTTPGSVDITACDVSNGKDVVDRVKAMAEKSGIANFGDKCP